VDAASPRGAEIGETGRTPRPRGPDEVDEGCGVTTPTGSGGSAPLPGGSAPLPGGSARAAAARRLHPGTRSNPALDRLAELAARLVGSPAAQVSVLTDVQATAGGAGPVAGAAGTQGPLEDSLSTVTAKGGGPLVVPDAAADPRVSGLPPVTSGAVGAYLGVPLVGDDGHAVGALCVFDPAPRTWSSSDVSLLEQLAAAVVAELELAAVSAEHRAERAVWDLAAEAAGVGTFDLDLTSGELRLDDRLLQLSGLDRDTFTGTAADAYAQVHPDDLEEVTGTVERAVTTAGTYDAEYRILLPDGRLRWMEARGRTLCDADGTPVRLVGAAFDRTDRREGEAAVAHVLETMAVGYIALDRDWRMTYVNAEAERITGRPRAELVGLSLWEEFPATVATEFEEAYRRADRTGEALSFDAYYPAPLDVWVEVRVVASDDRISLYFLDITARRRTQDRAEQVAQRSALVARVTQELGGTLDADEAVGRLAQLVVPILADWCIVSLVRDGTLPGVRHGLRDVGTWHADPRARPLVEAYARSRLDALSEGSFLAQALRTGRPVAIPQAATENIRAVLAPGPARDLLEQLAPESTVVLPLRGRGRTVGLLTLFAGPDRPPITPEELSTAADIAGRAGMALDNARLYRQQRQLAEGLQRSMLTAPAQPDHVQVVVRYTPAAEAAQVGGDWYDAFLQPSGTTVVTIGDVLGHNTDAAAAMGQIRSMLRAIAVTTGAGPADILSRLDQAMTTLQMGTTATSVVARLEQTEDEAHRGVTRVHWSNAGHPPPMAIHPDGTVMPLVTLQSELLLGVLPGTERTQTEVTLDRGATLVLYTDGLVERRDQPLEQGLVRLRSTLEELASRRLDADALCDELLAKMLPAHPEDDVALIAVRLHRQDQLRPPEAGPRRTPPDVAEAPGVVPQPG
jgi:PAS domain S-box-containing protein